MTYAKPILHDNQFPPTPPQEQQKAGTQVQNIVSANHLFSQIHLRHKLKLAQTLLENYAGSSFLVFCGRKRDKFLLHKYLLKAGMKAHLAAGPNENSTAEDSAPIIISSDDCQFQNYKGKIAGVIHFDIPQKISSYANRINVLNEGKENISHAIVTQREVSMLEDFNERLGIEARPEIIPGYEDDTPLRL